MTRLKTPLLLAAGLCLSLGPPAQGANYDQEITTVAQAVSASVTKAEKKKISVLDFTDLQGNSSELGRFLAEELSVTLVMERRDFSLLDRANLKNILAEHKLTAEGLVNPDNAKKLGQFAGVDALVMGTITPLEKDLILTVKIITTDTAEIVGAARGKISKTGEIQQLLDHGLANGGGSSSASSSSGNPPARDFSAINTIQKFGNFTAEVLSFRLLPDGKAFAAIQIANTTKQTTIALGANSTYGKNYPGDISAKIIDDKGNISRGSKIDGLFLFKSGTSTGETGFAGIQYEMTGYRESHGDAPARLEDTRGYHWLRYMAEVKAGETLRFTLEFSPAQESRTSTPGSSFKLQVELITIVKKENNERPSPKLDNVYFDKIVPTKPSEPSGG